MSASQLQIEVPIGFGRKERPEALATKRILPIDAARGFAMAFVFLSHFSSQLDGWRPAMAEAMENVAMVATPTFLLISGAMLGLLQSSEGAANPELTSRLFHRGLLVAVLGHLLISLAASWDHHQSYAAVVLDRIYVTDVVGLCLMLVPRVAPACSAQRLAAIAVAVYGVALLGVYLWHPTGEAAVAAKQLLIGLEDERAIGLNRFVSPLLPYLALYLVGVPFGRALALARADRLREERLGNHALRLGLMLLGAGLMMKVLWWLTGSPDTGGLSRALHELTSPVRKIPPGPAYLLFFGGLGVASLGCFFRLAAAGRAERLLRGLAVIGQASFFVYVLQAYVFGPLLSYVPAVRSALWPCFFAASFGLLWLAALAWKSARGNRLLDITYRVF